MHVPRRNIELYLDQADTLDACHLTALRSLKEIARVNVLCWLALEPSTAAGDGRARLRLEHLHEARVAARLSRHMNDTVARNAVAAQEVSLRHGDGKSRPPSYIIHTVKHLEGEVPHDSIIGLHVFVSVLRDTCVVTGDDLPLAAVQHIILDAHAVFFRKLAGLNLTVHE